MSTTCVDELTDALRKRFPGRRDQAYLSAALRVNANFEAEGPVSDVDRLFLGGLEGDASDADVLIERTLVAIRRRNAANASRRRSSHPVRAESRPCVVCAGPIVAGQLYAVEGPCHVACRTNAAPASRREEAS